MKQLASFADILDALHQVCKLDIDVGLESVGEKGVIWDYPPVVDLQQHYSLKKAFSLKKRLRAASKLPRRLSGPGLSF